MILNYRLPLLKCRLNYVIFRVHIQLRGKVCQDKKKKPALISQIVGMFQCFRCAFHEEHHLCLPAALTCNAFSPTAKHDSRILPFCLHAVPDRSRICKRLDSTSVAIRANSSDNRACTVSEFISFKTFARSRFT